jgi:hypothetical protein
MSLLYCCDYFPLVTVSCAPTPPMPNYPTRGVASSATNLSVLCTMLTSGEPPATVTMAPNKRWRAGGDAPLGRVVRQRGPRRRAAHKRLLGKTVVPALTTKPFATAAPPTYAAPTRQLTLSPQPPHGRPGGSAAPAPRKLPPRQTPTTKDHSPYSHPSPTEAHPCTTPNLNQ